MATFQTVVLLNLSIWNNPNKPGTGYSLDVVHTIMDGQSKGVGVEKVYFRDGGAKRIGKPLGKIDLSKVWERKTEIKALMDQPPPVPQPLDPEPLTGGSLGGGTMDKGEF